jgi:FkbM family methyltransferase
VAMISYAQNREDVVLARLFDQDEGFYVDLGASHPVIDSVTKHFYERGWRGLNVEPLAEEYALLCADRSRDLCVQAVVTDRHGTVTLHVPWAEPGRSTTIDAVAAELSPTLERTTLEVPSVRLGELLDDEKVDHIDFLKIDVEGGEAAIIHDTDWAEVRPRVLVIEATRPGHTEPSHEAWEPVLLAAGYRCLLFDGLNRFYADSDDHEAAAALSTPANVHDVTEPYQWFSRVQSLQELLQVETEARRQAEATALRLAAEASADERLAGVSREVAALADLTRRLARGVNPGGQLLADPNGLDHG